MNNRIPRRSSIRARLLVFLIPSLLLLVVCAAAVTYGVALSVATSAYDRSLLDPALDMAQNVRLDADGPRLALLAQAQEALLYDHEDTLVFQIRAPNGLIIAGVDDLSAPSSLEPGERAFFDGIYRGQPVRIAAVRSDGGLYVQVGETLNKRRRLIWEILAAELVPTILIALAALGIAWAVIAHGIAPLARVRAELLGRTPYDLHPLDESRAPLEIAPAVEAFNRLLAQLRESIATQQRFVANAAHQLRTPLAGLQMHLELLLRRDLAADVQDEVETMHTATLHASHLAKQARITRAASSLWICTRWLMKRCMHGYPAPSPAILTWASSWSMPTCSATHHFCLNCSTISSIMRCAIRRVGARSPFAPDAKADNLT